MYKISIRTPPPNQCTHPYFSQWYRHRLLVAPSFSFFHVLCRYNIHKSSCGPFLHVITIVIANVITHEITIVIRSVITIVISLVITFVITIVISSVITIVISFVITIENSPPELSYISLLYLQKIKISPLNTAL